MITLKKLQELKSGQLSAEDNIKSYIKRIQKAPESNIFLEVNKSAIQDARRVDQKISENRAGKLAGLAIAVKANINVLGMSASCASKTLSNYKSTFDADVIQKIRCEDGIIIGIVNCDEFACGVSGTTSAFGSTINPSAKGYVPGGSSSGSAAAIAADMCDLAIGSDTGGSIRNPASHCGVVGFKPSYGRVSRYGLIDLAMSLDVIGAVAPDVYGAALLTQVISGYSENDPTTYREDVMDYTDFEERKISIGIAPQAQKLCEDGEIKELVWECANSVANKAGSELKEVDLKHTRLGVATYYPIVYTEFFSSTRKLDGRRFGKKIEESCGQEVLRRILGGREISRAEHDGRYYRLALQARRLIKKDFDEAFSRVDVIFMPTTPNLPAKINSKIDPKDAYAVDALTVPASLAGICAGVVNIGKVRGVPIGLQVVANTFNEKLLFDIMKLVEQEKSYKDGLIP